jgi:hypothetical protein
MNVLYLFIFYIVIIDLLRSAMLGPSTVTPLKISVRDKKAPHVAKFQITPFMSQFKHIKHDSE